MKTTGLIGLGEAGFSLALRLRQNGVTVVAYDPAGETRKRSAEAGTVVTSSVQAVVLHLPIPKIVWLMLLPGEPTGSVMAQLAGLLEAGDIVIDGGNSHFADSPRRYHFLKEKNISMLDIALWEGPDGMITLAGGDWQAFETCKPFFQKISLPDACFYLGETGCGHFTRQVCEWIESGNFDAIAEGRHALKNSFQPIALEELARPWSHDPRLLNWLRSQAPEASLPLRNFIENARKAGIPTLLIALRLLQIS